MTTAPTTITIHGSSGSSGNPSRAGRWEPLGRVQGHRRAPGEPLLGAETPVLENTGKPMRIPFECTDDDMRMLADSGAAIIAEEKWADEVLRITDIFRAATVRRFPPSQRQEALDWLREG